MAAEPLLAQPGLRPALTMTAPRERQAPRSSAHPTRGQLRGRPTMVRRSAVAPPQMAVHPNPWREAPPAQTPPARAGSMPERAGSRTAPWGWQARMLRRAVPTLVVARLAPILEAQAQTAQPVARPMTAPELRGRPSSAQLDLAPALPAVAAIPTSEGVQKTRLRTRRVLRALRALRATPMSARELRQVRRPHPTRERRLRERRLPAIPTCPASQAKRRVDPSSARMAAEPPLSPRPDSAP
jgi:hypothetical protein